MQLRASNGAAAAIVVIDIAIGRYSYFAAATMCCEFLKSELRDSHYARRDAQSQTHARPVFTPAS
jgi:hypothetical protein